MKIIIGKILASINSNNEEVCIFRLGGIKIANIYEDRIEIKSKIPAITKTFMSQTPADLPKAMPREASPRIASTRTATSRSAESRSANEHRAEPRTTPTRPSSDR